MLWPTTDKKNKMNEYFEFSINQIGLLLVEKRLSDRFQLLQQTHTMDAFHGYKMRMASLKEKNFFNFYSRDRSINLLQASWKQITFTFDAAAALTIS